jgi:hypothetical protein
MNEDTLGMIAVFAWLTITAATVGTIVRKGRPPTPLPWGGNNNLVLPSRPQNPVLAKHSAAVLVWGIFLTLAVAALMSLLHGFWPEAFSHTYKFLCVVSFPICWWAGYFIVRATRRLR